MARNRVQFQKGMSRAAFQDRVRDGRSVPGGVDLACVGRRAFRARPAVEVNIAFTRQDELFQCSRCRTQTSVKAGTLFHKSKVPLTKWFFTIYLITQSKNDISALELSRQLGVKYDTAWLMKHKLMAVMGERNKAYKFKGSVQIDDAYLGGERKGTSGRGAEGKTPFSPPSRPVTASRPSSSSAWFRALPKRRSKAMREKPWSLDAR